MTEVNVCELQELAEKHAVRYEVWMEYGMVEGAVRPVGFELDLLGTHDHGHTVFSPGCDLCKETYGDLRKIAGRILPTAERPTVYNIAPFDHALHLTPKRGLAPEVRLSVHIEHRHDRDQPIDSCEELCLKEMEGKLASLGIKGGRGTR